MSVPSVGSTTHSADLQIFPPTLVGYFKYLCKYKRKRSTKPRAKRVSYDQELKKAAFTCECQNIKFIHVFQLSLFRNAPEDTEWRPDLRNRKQSSRWRFKINLTFGNKKWTVPNAGKFKETRSTRCKQR
jgi:hypothetical protein